ncbi:MAG: AraC family transcriptional regulator ligand-binding domain-containing protein [Glaciecola sp.]
MPNQGFLPVYYLGHFVHVLREHAYPIDAWLQQKGFSSDSIYDANTRIKVDDFDSLLANVLVQTNSTHIGLTLGRRLQLAHHGTFGLALLNCENLAQMIEFVKHYLAIRVPFIELATNVIDQQVVVFAKDTHWQGHTHRFVIEAVTGAMFNLFHAVQNKVPSLHIDTLFFDYPAPEYAQKYAVFDPVKVIFNHGYCGMAFDQELLYVNIPNVDKLSYLQAQKACADELAIHMQSQTLKAQCEKLMMQMGNIKLTLPQLADKLGISQRSLHRQLEQQGSSYKLILAEHQSSLAKEYLLVHQYSVTQTAQALGFEDMGNFRRAFKRWYKCTPSEFKQRHIQASE